LAEFSVSDLAGNTASADRFYLIDDVPPIISKLVLPAAPNSREPTRITFSASDNIGLLSAFATASFPSVDLRYDIGTLGASFGPPFVTSISRDFTLGTFPRCINNQKLNTISLTAVDQARLLGTSALTILPSQLEDCGAIGNNTWLSIGMLKPVPDTVYTLTGTTLRVEVGVPVTSTDAPFSRVEFYQANGGGYKLVGFGTPSLIFSENAKRWVYSVFWAPRESAGVGTVSVLALLVDQDGDATSVSTTLNVLP
jgi:hypothetical protein